MAAAHRLPVLASLALIAIVIGLGAAIFAYTAGWFSPQRLAPGKVVAAFAPPGGAALGHRRNHAKGICFTGLFEANGAGSEHLKTERFFKQEMVNYVMMFGDGKEKTFALRGVKGNPRYLHDERSLTLEDTVEFFN
jgi:hypothetical protein